MSQDVLITGLPRSGTSYFCKLLNEIDNFAIINEPRFDSPAFFNEAFPSNLRNLYADFRSQIKAGNQIRNKIVEDTLKKNERSTWIPTNIKDHDFVLGIKNTLKFLFLLNTFFEQESHIKVIALVRHPYHSISSWKNSFEHLRTANLAISRNETFRRYHLSDEQKMKFDVMMREENLSVRRCLLWNLATQCVLAHKERIHIIKYEEWTENPTEIIGELFQLPQSLLPSTITKSSKKKSPLCLSDNDIHNISTICNKNANLLGYNI